MNMLYFNWQNLDPGGFNLFAMSRPLIKTIGYFDENYFPVSDCMREGGREGGRHKHTSALVPVMWSRVDDGIV
jgi:hypothetical protein